MSTRNILHRSTVAAILASGTVLLSQTTTGALSGRITDSKGAPVANARIQLESPALFQAKVVTTDAKGDYRAQLLPVGNYTVKVSKEGMLGKSATDVRVGLGANLTINFTLQAQASSSITVEVVSNQTQESKTEDKVSVNFSAEQLLQLPTDRSFGGALALAPGVMGSGMHISIRGGSVGSDAGAKGGAGYAQVLYRIDGIDVKDDSGTQWDQTNRATLHEPLPDSIEDVQVVLSALNARYGRTQGGQVNILTKSGSNTFAGSLRGYMNRPSWSANMSKGPVNNNVSETEINATEGFSRFMDLTLSGPLIKDRLWFYFGTRFQPREVNTSRLGYDGYVKDHEDIGLSQAIRYPLTTLGHFEHVDHVLTDADGLPAGYQFMDLSNRKLSDWGTIVPRDKNIKKFDAKLTGQLSPNHTLSLTLLSEKHVTSGMSGERSYGQWAMNKKFMGDQTDKANAYTLTWNGSLNERWFVEARASRATYEQGDVLGDTTYPIFVQAMLGTGDRDTQVISTTEGGSGSDPVTWYGPTFVQRSSGATTANKRGNQSINVNVKTFQEMAGQHEIDLGFEHYTTEHAFGRDRNGDMGIFSGGFIINPSSGQFLFPTFFTAHEAENLLAEDDRTGTHVQYWDYPMRGPGAHVERYWVKGSTSKNFSQALWANDTWTVNDRLTLMGGLRYNKFVIEDTDGRKQADTSITEPRFQIKFNPDGKGAEVYSLSFARLASSYSDEMASNFRANGWYVRTVHGWNGLPGQPGVDTDEAAHDPTAGVRWVNYNQLIDLKNYATTPYTILDNRQTYVSKGLAVPYANEMTLGYQRNLDNGFVRLNYVQREYAKEWVGYIKKGYGFDPEFMVLVKDPSGTGPDHPSQWQQINYFINSDQKKTYRGLELAWNQNLTSRLTFGGNYTWSQLTGRDATQYYNYRAQKDAEKLNPDVYAPEGTLMREQVAHLYFTYVHPVGKGNVSASVLVNYWTGGVRSLFGVSDFGHLPELPHDDGKGNTIKPPDLYAENGFPIYRTYWNAPGAFKGGSDIYQVNLRLQAQFPIWNKVMLTTYLQVDNLFNRILKTHQNDWGQEDYWRWSGSDNPVGGRALANFNRPWGYAGDSSYYTAGRTYAQFSVGLKF